MTGKEKFVNIKAPKSKSSGKKIRTRPKSKEDSMSMKLSNKLADKESTKDRNFSKRSFFKRLQKKKKSED